MAIPSSPLIPKLLFFVALASLSPPSLHALDSNGVQGSRRRALMSFKEIPQGSNSTFECSPSGPCVPCQFSEKSNEKYRCSETGYRIPLRCVVLKESSKAPQEKIPRRASLESIPKDVKLHAVLHSLVQTASYFGHNRKLLSDTVEKEKKEEAYITYRSCIQSVNEEKVSMIGFEAFVFGLLLMSGSVMYVRKRRSASASGFARIQSNARH